MILNKLYGKNFCCFREVEFSLNDMGLVWVGGENKDTKSANNNGSGKSTLFKLLTWVLFGKTIDEESTDKVIRLGTKAAIGKLTILDGSDEWTIVRERRKGSPVLKLLKPDGKEFNENKKALQEKICEMLGGIDFLAFKNTCLYGQNDHTKFAASKTKDSDRKEMLSKILRIGALKHCHKIASELRKANGVKINEKQGEIENIESRCDELGVEELVESVEEWERKNHSELLALENSISESKNSLKKISPESTEELDEKISSTEKKIKKIKEKHSEISDKVSGSCKMKDSRKEKHKKIVTSIDKLAKKKSLLKHKIKECGEKLNSLSGDKCDQCNSPLKQGEGLSYVESIKGTKTSLEEELSSLRSKKDKLEQKEEALSNKIDEFFSLVDEKQSVGEKEMSFMNKLIGLKKNKEKVDKQNSQIETRINNIKHDISSLEENLFRVKQEENPYKELLFKANAKLEKYKKKVSKLEKKKKKLEKKRSYYEFWVRGFSNQGLPSFILDSIMPYISKRANYYLRTLSDGDITMDFSTQREKKSSKGDFKDEIDISWEIEGVDGSYPPSGGQMKKMEIATDLALMDLVASREGGIDLLILDEVLDGLDDEGRQRVLTLLKKMRKKRNSIFVISHAPNMAEIFEKSITVIKTDKESVIQVRA